MKIKKIFIMSLFAFCALFICGSISSKAASKEYNTTKPFFDQEFYEGDFHLFNKGYYLIVGSGDFYPIEVSGSIQKYYHNGTISANVFKENITVESGYESGIDEIVSNYNATTNIWDKNDTSIMIRVDNYARLLYKENGEGCILFCFGIEIPQEENPRYHVVDFDSKLSVEEIENKI